MQIYHQWNGYEFNKKYEKAMNWQYSDYDDAMENILSNAENRIALSTVVRFFEGLGVQVKRGLIDVSLVDDLMSGSIIRFWELAQPFIEEYRAHNNYPNYGEWVEYLCTEVKAIYDQQYQELAT